MYTARRRLAFLCASVALAACHGGGGGYSGNNNSQTYTVGGTVSGLAGTGLVLQNNGGNNLALSASGAFTFSSALANGAAYGVSVLTQPSNPSQTCTVTSGSGSVGAANVTSVQLTCSTNSYAVGGTVTGLDAVATGLVLQNNAGNDLTINGNGGFAFTTQVASGAGYAVTIKTQPNFGPLQTCTVTNGSGTVTSAAVSTVTVACATRTAKFLMVANPGLPPGSGVGANTVSVYTINASTGALTPVAGSPFPTKPNPRYVTGEPTGKFMYVPTLGSTIDPPQISAFSVNNSTGVLTELAASPFDLSVPPPAPNQLAMTLPIVHSSGAFGYTIVWDASVAASLYGATIESTTGALSQIQGTPLAVGYQATGPAFDVSGKFLFVPRNATSGANGEVASFQVSAPSGVLTPIGTFPTGGATPIGASTPDGKFFIVANTSSGTVAVFTVDSVAGTLSMVGSPVATAGTNPGIFMYHRRLNVLYVPNQAASGGLAAFSLDTTSGTLTPLANSPYGTNGAIAFPFLHPSGKFLYQVNTAAKSLQRYSIEQGIGIPTLLADVTMPTDPPSLLVPDFSGRFVYVTSTSAGTVSSYSVDQTTGALTLVNTVASGAGAFVPQPVGLQ